MIRGAIIFARVPVGVTAFLSELPRRLVISLRTTNGLTAFSADAITAPIGRVRSAMDGTSLSVAQARDAISFARQPAGLIALSSESPSDVRGLPRNASDAMPVASILSWIKSLWAPSVTPNHAMTSNAKILLFSVANRSVDFLLPFRVVSFSVR
jgi:hypothetical protein